MTKSQFVLIGIVSAILSSFTSNASSEEVKLIGNVAARHRGRLPADIAENSIIIGIHDVDEDRINGSAKIFVRTRQKWELSAELIPNDQDNAKPGRTAFGFAVAITSLPGRSADYAIVGAPNHDGVADNAGAAYIFVRKAGTWRQQAKLFPADAAESDAFGHFVSIDRTTAVIGAPSHDGSANNAGAAYIFVRDGDTWIQRKKIVPMDLGRSDGLGGSVYVRGKTVLVGAPGHTHGGVRFAGAVYVFAQENEVWTQQAKLTADEAGKSDRFGSSISMSTDRIIVGAPFVDANGAKDVGAAYIFVRQRNGWEQEAKLIAPNQSNSNHFGAGVAIRGKIAIVGAPLHEEGALGTGAAYSFENIAGIWENRTMVVPDDAEQYIRFGSAISISGDIIVVSAGATREENFQFSTGTAAYAYSGAQHFNIPPYNVQPFGLSITTLGSAKHTALLQNFPNPFNPETWIPYRLSVDSPITLTIYNVQGKRIREFNLGTQNSGDYLSRETAIYWNGKNQIGETVSSGLYYYILHAGPFQYTRRMLIVK